MPIAAGTRLGPYEILAPIGAGGMGEVYKARDTKLDREVAIKVLPAALAQDPARLARFEREAKLLASLNHPHIAQIYGIEESSEVHALVMELVPGEPIRGPLPVATAINYARQIAQALEAAHEKGIVHRDLKPANILVTRAGIIKVLDFGLATLVEDAPASDANPEDSPTMAMALTQEGMVMGTVAYMSPEQARGKPVDRRTDVWSFGVVLFEMLTGRQLFGGETVSDTIAAVLMTEPDFTALPPDTPANVRALLARCLARDLNHRLRDIGEARHQLEHTSSPSSSIPSATSNPPSASISPSRGRKIEIFAAVGVLLIAVAVFLWQKRPSATVPPATTSPQAPTQSIAVLPFVNQSGNPDDEYFSDGMTDELASALMKVSGLRVAAHSSTFTFKGKPADAREVGSQLHVASVLEGTVRRAGSKLRVTAELVNAADGLALWSERYERDAKDIFKVQDDITGAIVSALRLKLGATTPNQTRRPENVEAHDLYLRGRFMFLKGTEDGFRKSLDYFSQALAKDPGYVLAYDGMADAWSFLADAFLPPREAYPKAQDAAMKALELDALDGDAQSRLAAVRWFYAWDIPAADEGFRRSLQLNPNSADVHYLRSWFLCSLKRWDEGFAETERAIALDPLSPIPSWVREYCFCMSRRFDEALAQHAKTSELDPNFFYVDVPAAIAYREKGMFAESVAEYQRLQKVTGQPMAGLAVTYARMGKTSEARTILREMLDLASRKYVSPELVALIYVSLGEKNQAFIWLDKAYQARSAWLITGVLVLPQYDPIRGDTRYTALLKKMGLEK